MPEGDARRGTDAAGEGALEDRVLRPEAGEAERPKMPTPVIASVPAIITQKVSGISFRSAP